MINNRPLSIPVILGTTRKGRISAHAARFMTEQIANRQGVTTDLIDISQMPLPVDDAGNFGNVANVFDESGKLLDQAFIKRADTDGPTDGCRFSATKPARLRGKPAAPPGNLRLE